MMKKTCFGISQVQNWQSINFHNLNQRKSKHKKLELLAAMKMKTLVSARISKFFRSQKVKREDSSTARNLP